MSTHRGTSLISRLLLHVLQVEIAPLTELADRPKGNTKAPAVGDGRGTSFWNVNSPWHKFNLKAPSPHTPSRNRTPC